MKRIYLSPPHLDGRERELLPEAHNSNWITKLGPHVDAFEKEICQTIGIKHAAALARPNAPKSFHFVSGKIRNPECEKPLS